MPLKEKTKLENNNDNIETVEIAEKHTEMRMVIELDYFLAKLFQSKSFF